ncbi:MAG: hypothetical protein GC190_14905 [Alphaproteobacteria bacterium]|nr:hypothetical protein [Alphaproteobacteria bacterium]
MKRLLMTTCAVGLSLAATPASAAWDKLGSVSVQSNRDHDRVYDRFGGPVERLQFVAEHGDVYCRSVRVTFGNGHTRRVFSGRLNEDRRRVVDLPGDQRNIRRIDLRCRSLENNSARVRISADIGRYRSAWRQSPDWGRWWSHMFTWNADRAGMYHWVRLGSRNFNGRRDRETIRPGRYRARDLTAIALTPRDGDARCSRVRVEFANGRTRTLNIDRSDRLREDRVHRLDLPGNERNVTRINMACTPIGERNVTIDVYGAI